MPITVHADLRRPTQEEFAKTAYAVMGHAFRIHSELGRLFDEEIYQLELAARAGDSEIEVPVDVIFGDFRGKYYLDLLVAGASLFELKTVEALHKRHRSQVISYLLLADLSRAKLINFRTESVEHEFVNTKLRTRDRVSFDVIDCDWVERRNLRPLMV